MDFETYRPLALRTAKMFDSPRQNLRHAAMGFLTEAGELMTIFKRVEIYGKPFDDAMRADAIEELGDFQWYVPLALMAIRRDPTPFDPTTDDIGDNWKLLESNGDFVIGLNGICAIIAIALFNPNSLDNSDIEAVADACGILNYGIEHMAGMLGTTADEMRRLNIEKLRLRFPERYTDEAAESRADKGGLDARHS